MKAKLLNIKTNEIFEIEERNFSIGRGNNNNIIINNPYVSRNHCRITVNQDRYFAEDLNSRNGTFINGELINNKTRLKSGDIISFSYKAPMFKFIDESYDLKAKIGKTTLIIIPYLVPILLTIAAFFYIYIFKLEESKNFTEYLIVRKELNNVIKKIGKKKQKVDNYFINKIGNYINKYKNSYDFEASVIKKAKHDDMIKSTFSKYNIPYEFSSLAIVESYYIQNAYNHHSGAKGIWQLMPQTARHYGLKVNGKIDERTDPVKSTKAAALYLNDLISLFGYESFLLAIAAYNAGEGVINTSLRKIENPKSDRNFWYLYKKNLLPYETKEYVLKVLAVMIILDGKKYINTII